ncbi:MAG TPA: laccase domain-containing protein [Desulfobulbus sp.]|nr:laccase domain-containing protein [Desulfobulbus sp.]
MFTRHGGTSPEPFSSLNLSYGVGDDPVRVAGNRRRVCRVLGIEALVSATQVHSDRVHLVTGPMNGTGIQGVDALVTDRPGLGLLVLQADCQAVLLHDPEHRAIGAVHSGWRGSVRNVIGRTIAKMMAAFATDPSRLLAFISPSLGPCCSQFINHGQELPPAFAGFRSGRDYFNFWEISRWQLQQCGVREDNIRLAGICTRCSRDFFSFRRAKVVGDGITGRNGSVIMLSA